MSELEIKKITRKHFTKALLRLATFILGMITIEFFFSIYLGNPSTNTGTSWGTTLLPMVMLLVFFDAVQKVLIDIHKQKNEQPE
jgi:hypothetical protein